MLLVSVEWLKGETEEYESDFSKDLLLLNKNRMQYGELYHRNFYREVTEKNQVHYEYYNLGMKENVPEDYMKSPLYV